MKSKHKLFGIIAASVAIIGFSFAACTINTSGGEEEGKTYNYCITAAGLCIDGPFTVAECNGQVANSCPSNPNPGGSSPSSSPSVGGSSSSITSGNVAVTGVTLNQNTLSLPVGSSVTLTATVAPSNASNKAVTWSTSDATKVTVVNGLVTALAAGTATITVTADGGKTATCVVTVPAWVAVPESTFGTITTGASTINDIAYGNGKFVAVGGYDSGKMAYSTDGVTWTAVSEGIYCQKISYGNGKFVAGYGSYYSTDGETWTEIVDDFGSSYSFNAIAYGNGKFVAAVYNLTVYSTDGVTWTVASNRALAATNSYVRAIAYGNGKFVAVGIIGDMAYLEDN